MEKYYDFSSCEKGHKQYGGSDEKQTIYFNGNRYMLKFPDKIPFEKRNDLNSSSRNNIFSEYVACHIIETLGIPVQETILGLYKDKTGLERPVVACKDFCTDGYQLNEFQEYNSSNNERFKEIKYPNIDDIVSAIQDYEESIKDIAIERFWDTFVIDAILGNFDRHTGNWGYLYNDEASIDKVKLAPIYDCGSSLYPMLADKGIQKVLDDQNMINERIYTYPKAAFSYNGKQIHYHKFLISDKALNDPAIRKSVNKIYERYDKTRIDHVIDNTPLISDIRKELYKTMIDERMDKLIVPYINHQKQIINFSNDITSTFTYKTSSISQEMENLWQDYFNLPKHDRKGIEWNGEKLRPAVFDDLYLAQCEKENVAPSKEIYDHFWNNCVKMQDYQPKYCGKDQSFQK